MTRPISYFCVKTQSAPKSGLNSQGSIAYSVLRDADSHDAHICLLSNDAGGYHSQEAVPFSAIKACIDGVSDQHPIPAKIFKGAFHGRSANNSGFLVAVLRHEGLLQPAPDAAHKHIVGGSWDDWLKAVLSETGDAFELPEMVKAKAKAAAAISNDDVPERTKGKKPRNAPTGKRERPIVSEDGGSNACPA